MDGYDYGYAALYRLRHVQKAQLIHKLGERLCNIYNKRVYAIFVLIMHNFDYFCATEPVQHVSVGNVR